MENLIDKFELIGNKVAFLEPTVETTLHLDPATRKEMMDASSAKGLEIFAVGPECKIANPGDHVIFDGNAFFHSLQEIKIEDQVIFIIPESTIVVKLNIE